MSGIIVGVDGSDHSRRALRWAMQEAVLRRVPLTVMTVVEDPARPATGIYWGVHRRPGNGVSEEHVRNALRKFADQTAGEIGGTVPDVTVRVATGETAAELVSASRDADLLVVGCRGEGGFARLLMGSVSSQVAQHAECPVAVIRGAGPAPLAVSGDNHNNHRPRRERRDIAQEAPTMVEHRLQFQQELEAIEAKVIELYAMVAEDLTKATDALLTGNSDAIKVLAEREQVIDALYPEIEQLANRAILLQAPVASDLRFLLSVLRIVPELERSHDLVEHIARRANHLLSEDLSPRSRGLVGRMGDLVSDMWRQATDSWYQRDGSAAAILAERDEEMDELHASLIAELASGKMTLPVTMEMTLVARFYERLGDHAVNVARRVVYLAGSQPPD